MGPTTRKGINAQRRLLNPSSGIDGEIHDLQTGKFPGIIFKGVVVDVLNDPETRTAVIEKYSTSVQNPVLLNDAPRNSLIVRIVSGGSDRRGASPLLCYPFLPPFLSLPVKAGEYVWIMFENPTVSMDLGYWMWRVAEPESVDDLNYTHGDRKFDKEAELSTIAKLNAGSESVSPGFINGGGTEESYTLKEADDYETIVKDSESYKNHTAEPVPRFRKRSSDTVLQGSNNALIVLGEDRVAGPTKTDSEKKDSAGALDFVAGRGRFGPASDSEDPTGTAARVITNQRGDQEVDKNPGINGNDENFVEGDPDFENDASRVYVAQRTDGDSNFSVLDNLPDPLTGTYDEIADEAFIICKSDHIRIIARKNPEKGITGTIRIIKEGDKESDLAGMVVEADARVHIHGDQIFLGRKGASGPGPSGSEPFTKFSVRQAWLESFIDTLNSLIDSLSTNFAAPQNATPGYGAPNPGLVAAIATLQSTKATLETLKTEIPNAQSARIFGE